MGSNFCLASWFGFPKIKLFDKCFKRATKIHQKYNNAIFHAYPIDGTNSLCFELDHFVFRSEVFPNALSFFAYLWSSVTMSLVCVAALCLVALSAGQ